MNFQNVKVLLKKSLIIYTNFESVLETTTEKKDDDPNTKNIKIILFPVMA